jgi:DNA mismatch repair ATPase MutS
MIVEEIIEELRRCYSIQKVAERLRISRTRIRTLLLLSYNCKNIYDLRKKMKIKKLLSDKKIAELKQVKELYDKFLTLQKTAEQLNISRERVRQLLNEGEKYCLFQYKLSSETKFKELLQRYDRKTLIKEIKLLKYPSKICPKLHIKRSEFKKLVKHYNINLLTIDYKDYYLEILEKKKSKYLAKYYQIVDTLGHHPSTTKMSTKKEWIVVWRMILHYWGSMANFRKEYGIEKPKYRRSLLRRKSSKLPYK